MMPPQSRGAVMYNRAERSPAASGTALFNGSSCEPFHALWGGSCYLAVKAISRSMKKQAISKSKMISLMAITSRRGDSSRSARPRGSS